MGLRPEWCSPNTTRLTGASCPSRPPLSRRLCARSPDVQRPRRAREGRRRFVPPHATGPHRRSGGGDRGDGARRGEMGPHCRWRGRTVPQRCRQRYGPFGGFATHRGRMMGVPRVLGPSDDRSASVAVNPLREPCRYGCPQPGIGEGRSERPPHRGQERHHYYENAHDPVPAHPPAAAHPERGIGGDGRDSSGGNDRVRHRLHPTGLTLRRHEAAACRSLRIREDSSHDL